MGTTANFDLTQTAFMFNWIANSACIARGSASALADFVYCSLYGMNVQPPLSVQGWALPGMLPQIGSQLYGNPWNLVWGPGVYEFNDSNQKADNTAFVVYSASKDIYIVAIAGTNPAAFLNWLEEDLQVGPQDCVNWSGFSPTGPEPTPIPANQNAPQISLGTALGLWALGSQLQVTQYSKSSGTLVSFLQSLTGASTTQVIFTGHSLGGALSPTLANWALGPTGMTNFKGKIYAMPTAGPTPGNGTYQKAWDAAFQPYTPSGTFNSGNMVQALNRNVWNDQDVVPHAWQYILTSDATQFPPYFFYTKDNILLHSPDGDIAYALIGNWVKKAQDAGAGAFMTMAQNTTPFDIAKTTTTWPIQYYKDGFAVDMSAPGGIYADDLTYLGNLGTIHVWGYGPFAFNIDFSVFQQIHPQPLLTSSPSAS